MVESNQQKISKFLKSDQVTYKGLEKENYIIYSCTKYREKNYEITIDIHDKDLNIKWPSKKKIVSKKDKKGITFQKYKEVYL